MTDYNKKRNTFLMAVAVILLCLVSITGATLALFTSNIEDGTIGINSTSGSLDVDIIDATNNPSTLVGKVLRFVDFSGELVSSETDILFEPGALYYTEGFRVANNGNIPMYYIAYMSEDENFSKEFYDAFEVWITTDPTDRSNMEKLERFEGRLEPEKCSEVYYLVFRMKETIGNKFQNKTFTGVGITVCAVQGNVKID